MRNFSTFVLLVIVLWAVCGNGPVVMSEDTCEKRLLGSDFSPDYCTEELCAGNCYNVYGDTAVGTCIKSEECYCSFPC
ncbi:hypothetical protein SLEP1_g9342 [Rubroshorea leprosula]|uniref:Defensin-like protein n=1 Tax=Rubroshorea leprosula TaxID=152421 RepID=A0AAV5ID08_9ROSI|nr:hypothetical protein SLEP1_g9342 [Rubroshorea leprosula]